MAWLNIEATCFSFPGKYMDPVEWKPQLLKTAAHKLPRVQLRKVIKVDLRVGLILQVSAHFKSCLC